MKIEICESCGKTRIDDECEWCRYQDADARIVRRGRMLEALVWTAAALAAFGPPLVAWIQTSAR